MSWPRCDNAIWFQVCCLETHSDLTVMASAIVVTYATRKASLWRGEHVSFVCLFVLSQWHHINGLVQDCSILYYVVKPSYLNDGNPCIVGITSLTSYIFIYIFLRNILQIRLHNKTKTLIELIFAAKICQLWIDCWYDIFKYCAVDSGHNTNDCKHTHKYTNVNE